MRWLPTAWLHAIYRCARDVVSSRSPPATISLHGDDAANRTCALLLRHAEIAFEQLPGAGEYLLVNGERLQDPIARLYYAAALTRTLPRSHELSARLLSLCADFLRASDEELPALIEEHVEDQWAGGTDVPSVVDFVVCERIRGVALLERAAYGATVEQYARDIAAHICDDEDTTTDASDDDDETTAGADEAAAGADDATAEAEAAAEKKAA